MPIFLTPIYLLAGLGAAIPLVLHLIHRRKPRPVRFSTLRFLRAAAIRTRRARRLNRILLLALRMLILLGLAMAFAKPLLRSAGGLPRGQRTVVIVLDGSASMRTMDGDVSAFEKARAWAFQVVESLSPGDRVALVVPGTDRVRRVFPPVSDHARARRELDSVQCGFSTIDFPAELRRIRSELGRMDERSALLELHVFSDFQTSNWRFAENSAADDESAADDSGVIFLNRVSPSQPVNAGIVSATFQPEAVVGDGGFKVLANLAAASGYDGHPRVGLFVGDEEQHSAGAVLAEGGDASVRLFGHPGASRTAEVHGTVRLEPDAFAADNTFYFSLPRIKAVNVAVVDDGAVGGVQTERSAFLRRALTPGGAGSTIFNPETMTRTVFLNSDLSGFHAVFLLETSVVTSATSARLREFAEEGGLCFVFPDRIADGGAAWKTLFPEDVLELDADRLNAPETFILGDGESVSALEGAVRRILPFPLRVTIEKRLRFRDIPQSGRGFLEYSDGGAFMVEVPVGRGRIWLASVAPERGWSNWVLSPLFVVGIQEMLRSGLETSEGHRFAVVGENPELYWPNPVLELPVVWELPDGTSDTVLLTRQVLNRPFELPTVHEPGLYRLTVAETEHVYAVNNVPDELEIGYSSNGELAEAFAAGRLVHSASWFEQEARIAEMSFGRPLWPLILVVVFFLVLTETAYSNWLSRKK